MTEEEMWEAVRNSDENYDGLFFYAVRTTGIFCRPSCKSKLPRKENICYFASAKQARASGFRPCKRCRSDLLEFQPMQEIAEEVRKKLDEAIAADKVLSFKELGLTPRRLTEIFKREYGMTPKEYIDALRVQAFHNSAAVAMCNRVGREDKMDFSGESIVVDANGDVIAKADDAEGILYAEVDLAKSSEIRSRRTYTGLRRTELYK